MDRHQLELLRRIQELEFVAVDLNLFLDTHPNDKAALRDFTRVTDELKKLKHAYEHRYALLTAGGHNPGRYPWNWIEEPWPWEIEY